MGEIVKLIKVKDREPLQMAALFRILAIFREKGRWSEWILILVISC